MRGLAFGLLCLVLLIGGCGGSDSESVGGTGGGGHDAARSQGTELPKDFPQDVLIYKPSTVTTVVTTAEGYVASLTSADDKVKIVESYKKEMKAKGWTEESTIAVGPQTVLIYEKGKRLANISVGPLGEQIQITLTVTR
jgi:hypothetical protein